MLQTYLQLFACTLVPIGLTVSIFLLQRFTSFKKIPYKYQQIIIGVVFGLAAIFGTECGVDVSGAATANVRDAAPLCAGLIFGGPSGLIAGLIGGVERYFAAYWGRGFYSQIACSLSTILAGVYAAVLRKWMYENKAPKFIYGFAIGIIMEVIHITILFLTHITEPATALNVIRVVTIPMVFANAVAVSLSCLFVQLMNIKDTKLGNNRPINQRIQFWLLIITVSAFFASTGFIYLLQKNSSDETGTSVLNTNVVDIGTQINEYSDSVCLNLLSSSSHEYEENPSITLTELCEKYDIYKINIVNKNGIVIKSSDPAHVGYDMNSDPITRDFHINMLTHYTGFDIFRNYGNDFVKYSAMHLMLDSDEEYYYEIGLDIDTFYDSGISGVVNIATSHRHVYFSGVVLVFDSDGRIISYIEEGETVPPGITITDLQAQPTLTKLRADIYAKDCYYMYDTVETYYVVCTIPVEDINYQRDLITYSHSFSQVIMFAVIFAFTYFIINKFVVKNIRDINNTLGHIIAGDLNQKVGTTKTLEFNELSHDINVTVDTLKRYIEQAAARIDKELEFARMIQSNAIPSVFPPFPTKKEFDIYAKMDTARQVGGDFYDFYLLDGHTLAFLIADVSGKGVPASMFMMESKTLLKNLARYDVPVNETLEKANEALCQNNTVNMFVTCWMGILDLHTGILTFANAGHNAPLIYKADGNKKWEFLEEKRNLVLGGLNGIKYDLQSIKLEKGDRLYLYTDGVNEATNENKELYGNDRLINYLNEHKSDTQKELLYGIKEDIDKFAGDADQFDDITMLILDFKGASSKKGYIE